MDNVSWSHCSFYDNDFDEVSFRQSPVKYTKFEDCKLKLAMIDCQWQSLDFLNCSIGISSSDSRIGKSKLSNCKLEVRAASMMEGVSGSSNSGFIFNSTKFDSCTIAVDREVFFSNCTFDQCQFNDVSVTYEGITDSVLRNCSGNMEITFRHEDQAKTVANYLEESNTNLVLKIILPKKRH
ncbi:MAG: pentapeptide repeat-containing protein [Acidobacteria bacterium]|nr:pentapeptide repeat-containing protein [Acidobacteriota bacterium]